jgi:hypothetical protein
MIELPFRLENISELSIFQEDVNANTDNLTPEEIEKITCPISLSIMSEPIMTSCNHLFCKKNLEKCGDKCPICRQQILHYTPEIEISTALQKIKWNFADKEYKFNDIICIEQIKMFIEKYKFFPAKKNKKKDYYCGGCEATNPRNCCCKKPSKRTSKKEYCSECEEDSDNCDCCRPKTKKMSKGKY